MLEDLALPDLLDQEGLQDQLGHVVKLVELDQLGALDHVDHVDQLDLLVDQVRQVL